MEHRLECIDAGSEYCPCYLAETNDCITCSHLQNKDFCDCNWRGVCIYQEYVMNKNKSKAQRDAFTCQLEEKRKIGDKSFVIKLKTTKTLARLLKEPGAYVFLRNSELPQYFDVPMSIMDVDEIEGYIYIAYQILGTKTKRLNEIGKELLIRGPYWNAVYGLKNLKRISNLNCLLIVRGIAQAPSILVIKKLLKNKNNVILIVDKGNVGEIFIEDIIKDFNIQIIEEDVMSDKGKSTIKNTLIENDIGFVYSGGSDILHKSVIDIIDQLYIDPYLAVTNNNEICCGEGVCGGCTIRFQDGTKAKSCKTQLDARKVIERRVIVD